MFAKNLSYTVGIKDCFGYGHSVRWIAKVKHSGENLAWIGVTEIDFSKIIGGINGVKDCFVFMGIVFVGLQKSNAVSDIQR